MGAVADPPEELTVSPVEVEERASAGSATETETGEEAAAAKY